MNDAGKLITRGWDGGADRGRLLRHHFRRAAPPRPVGHQAGIAIGIHEPAADGDLGLILPDHATAFHLRLDRGASINRPRLDILDGPFDIANRRLHINRAGLVVVARMAIAAPVVGPAVVVRESKEKFRPMAMMAMPMLVMPAVVTVMPALVVSIPMPAMSPMADVVLLTIVTLMAMAAAGETSAR